MKIIIDIEEKIFKELTKYNEPVPSGNRLYDSVLLSIYNGTPLPEYHGRLISEEDMLSVIIFSKLFDGAKVGDVKEALLNIPTIIERSDKND